MPTPPRTEKAPKNPPAFPFAFNTREEDALVVEPGMTLRDYFAAKAMQAFCDGYSESLYPESAKRIADGSYRMADALLAARQEGQPAVTTESEAEDE